MIELMRKLSLKSVLESDRNVEDFGYILNLISETNFRQLPLIWGSRSKRRDQSDVSGQRSGANGCYDNPYTRAQILEHEYLTLRRSSRPVRPANYPTWFDHDVEIPGWEEDRDEKVRYDRTSG